MRHVVATSCGAAKVYAASTPAGSAESAQSTQSVGLSLRPGPARFQTSDSFSWSTPFPVWGFSPGVWTLGWNLRSLNLQEPSVRTLSKNSKSESSS